MISEEDIALIDRFLAGELDGLERVEFERRVKNDLEFAKEIRSQQKIVDNLRVIGAAKMAASVKADMGSWKAEGYQSYKPSTGMSTLTKVIIGVVAVGAIAAAYFLTTNTERFGPTPEQGSEEVEVVDTMPQVEPSPGMEVLPPAIESDSAPDTITQNVTRMVTDGSTRQADIQLDVKDANTFNVELIKSEKGVYTYKISFDGKSQTIESDDPKLKETLMARAKALIDSHPKLDTVE